MSVLGVSSNFLKSAKALPAPMAVTFKVEVLPDPGRDGGAAFLEFKRLLEFGHLGGQPILGNSSTVEI